MKTSQLKTIPRSTAAGCSALLLLLLPAAQLAAETTEKPSTAEINNAVDSDLLFDSSVSANDIDVRTTDGIIYLSGTVDSHCEKSHAEDVTSRISGVTTVNNGLTVSYPSYSHYYWPYTGYYEPYYYNNLAIK